MVVRRGFEPRKAKPADLQSALVGHLSISPFDEIWSNTVTKNGAGGRDRTADPLLTRQ